MIKLAQGTPEVMHDEPAISIKEDMPLAHASDSLAQSMQAEQQNVYAAQEKIKTEAVNALVSMLHQSWIWQCKGSRSIISDNSTIDAMVTLDDAGTIKAVNIPVEIKADKIVISQKVP